MDWLLTCDACGFYRIYSLFDGGGSQGHRFDQLRWLGRPDIVFTLQMDDAETVCETGDTFVDPLQQSPQRYLEYCKDWPRQTARSFKDGLDVIDATDVFNESIKICPNIGEHLKDYLESGGTANYDEWGTSDIREGKETSNGRDEHENERRGREGKEKDKTEGVAEIGTPTMRTFRSGIARFDLSLAAGEY